MKAIVQDTYGSPDVLELKEIDKPQVGDDEALVRVHAASVNTADRRVMRGRPFVVRLAGCAGPGTLFPAPMWPVWSTRSART